MVWWLLEFFITGGRRNWGGISGPLLHLRCEIKKKKKKKQNTQQDGGLDSKFKTLIYNDYPQRKTSSLASDSPIEMADGWQGSDC